MKKQMTSLIVLMLIHVLSFGTENQDSSKHYAMKKRVQSSIAISEEKALEVRLSTLTASPAYIKIYNKQDELVEFRVIRKPGLNQADFDLEGLENGSYTLAIKTEGYLRKQPFTVVDGQVDNLAYNQGVEIAISGNSEGQFEIAMQNSTKQPVTVQVLDADNKVVHDLQVDSGNLKKALDFSQAYAGNYSLQISHQNLKASQSIYIQ